MLNFSNGRSSQLSIKFWLVVINSSFWLCLHCCPSEFCISLHVNDAHLLGRTSYPVPPCGGPPSPQPCGEKARVSSLRIGDIAMETVRMYSPEIVCDIPFGKCHGVGNAGDSTHARRLTSVLFSCGVSVENDFPPHRDCAAHCLRRFTPFVFLNRSICAAPQPSLDARLRAFYPASPHRSVQRDATWTAIFQPLPRWQEWGKSPHLLADSPFRKASATDTSRPSSSAL